jgi:uncharacterized protein
MMTSDTDGRPDTSHAGLLARHPLVCYFFIAFVAAWLVWAPVVLSATGAGLLTFTVPPPVAAGVIAVGTFAPTLSAFIMTAVTEGKTGVRRLLRRYVLWRVKLRWYLFVLLVIPASVVLGAVVLPGVPASYQSPTLALVLSYPVAFVLTFVLGGPLGEEPGWRGFALPRLQLLRGPLLGSVVLGTLWAMWHLPLFWSGVWTPLSIPNIVMFILMITALTITMTWVFNNAKGSLLITMLMHASSTHLLTRLFRHSFRLPF